MLVGPDRTPDRDAPASEAVGLGFRSYLGLPLLAGDQVLAVLEAVHVARANLLDRHAEPLVLAMQPLAVALNDVRRQQPGGSPDAAPAQNGVAATTVLDLAPRPPVDPDDRFEVAPEEWALLLRLDGERPLSDAAAAQLAVQTATAIATCPLERDPVRVGREHRRRG